MKTLKILLISITALLIFASCCNKIVIRELPPATHEGAMTFGCRINGKVFKSNGYIGILSVSGINLYYDDSDSILNIIVKDFHYDENKTILNMEIKCEERVGTYYDIKINRMNAIPNSESKLNITRFGVITSGTFEFHGISESGEKISITDGRFDYDKTKESY